MKIMSHPSDDTLRFWCVDLPFVLNPNKEQRAKAKADRVTINFAKFRSYTHGIKTRQEAEDLARKIEAATGIEMEVSKHDYV